MDRYDCYMACSTSAVAINGAVYESKFKTNWPLTVKPDTIDGSSFTDDGKYLTLWGKNTDNRVMVVVYNVLDKKPQYVQMLPENALVAVNNRYIIITPNQNTFDIYELKD